MGTPPGRLQLISSQTLGAHVPRRLVALLDTIAREDHISRGLVVKRALVRAVEQHIRRAVHDEIARRRLVALRTLASPTTPAKQEEIDGFCKVLGLGDDWNYTPR